MGGFTQHLYTLIMKWQKTVWLRDRLLHVTRAMGSMFKTSVLPQKHGMFHESTLMFYDHAFEYHLCHSCRTPRPRCCLVAAKRVFQYPRKNSRNGQKVEVYYPFTFYFKVSAKSLILHSGGT